MTNSSEEFLLSLVALCARDITCSIDSDCLDGPAPGEEWTPFDCVFRLVVTANFGSVFALLGGAELLARGELAFGRCELEKVLLSDGAGELIACTRTVLSLPDELECEY